MIDPAYHFCPRCAGTLVVQIHEGQEQHVCSVCHETLYKNQNVCTDSVIIRNGKMLLVRRARDPKRGFLDLPGGFVNPNEKSSDGALREIEEELKVKGKIIRVLGLYGPSPYLYKGVTYYNGGAFFLVDIAGQEPVASDDVARVEWWPLDALPSKEEFAFTSQHEFFQDVMDGKIDLSL